MQAQLERIGAFGAFKQIEAKHVDAPDDGARDGTGNADRIYWLMLTGCVVLVQDAV